MAAKKNNTATVDVEAVGEETLTFEVIGVSPFVCNSMSTHGAHEILFPSPKKYGKEREATLKHNPPEEFRQSIKRSRDADAATLVEFPSAGFKRAMADAALELPGVNKSQIGRLCWVVGHTVPMYGVPEIWMTMVRQAGQNKTPDVRTRAILPEWATTVTVSYVTPNLREKAVANLVQAGGVFIGVGDGRPQKGALSFGRFEIVPVEGPKRDAFERIKKTGNRAAQVAAMDEPTPFDLETEELLEWWEAEVKRRGFKIA